MTFSTLLYVSDLAPGTTPSTVAKIAKAARNRNEQDGITGLLTFDGAHFAQLVEGPTERLDDLLARLQIDARHAAMEVLQFEPTKGDRLFTGWRLGFIEVPARGGMDRLRGLRGTEALHAFLQTLPPLCADTETSLPKTEFG